MNDAIIYSSGAGIQSLANDCFENIMMLNSIIPIKILNRLTASGYSGKFISFGSYFEIGSESNIKYYTENEILGTSNNVKSLYAISKRLFTRYFASVGGNLNGYHFILPNLYGKGENENRLIPYVSHCIRNGKNIRITNGEQIRQYVHSDDVSLVVEKCLCLVLLIHLCLVILYC